MTTSTAPPRSPARIRSDLDAARRRLGDLRETLDFLISGSVVDREHRSVARRLAVLRAELQGTAGRAET